MTSPIESRGGKEEKGIVDSLKELWADVGQKFEAGHITGNKIANTSIEARGTLFEQITEGFKQGWKQLVGVISMAAIGLLMDSEEFEAYKKERKDIRVRELIYSEMKNEGMVKGRSDVNYGNRNFEVDKDIDRKQRFVNMKAIRYFDEKTKRPFPQPKGRIGKLLAREKVRPSIFILQNSSALFKEGLGTFDQFKDSVSQKLVDPSVTNPQERRRQAAIILSCCAIGRFQILPHYHFKKMGWQTRGEEGLRDMYEFIKSTDQQIALYKGIVTPSWNRYHDAGYVAVAYYSGSAAGYKKNPNNPKYHKKQYGGHCSIHEYAQKARKYYSQFKSEFPKASDIDCVAMAIEKIESGGSVIKNRYKKKNGMGLRVA